MKTTTSFIEAARWNIDNYQLQSLRQRRGRLKALKNKFQVEFCNSLDLFTVNYSATP